MNETVDPTQHLPDQDSEQFVGETLPLKVAPRSVPRYPFLAFIFSLFLPGAGQIFVHNFIQGSIHLVIHFAVMFHWVYIHDMAYGFYYILIMGVNVFTAAITATLESWFFVYGTRRKRKKERRFLKEKALQEAKGAEREQVTHRVRFSLRFKLFIFVVLLVFGILFTTYYLITQEIESSLGEQLQQKGEAIAYQTVASAGIMMTDLKIMAEIERRTPDISEYKLKLVDLISKRDHPRDVVYSHITNENNVVIIHSEDILVPEEDADQKREFKPYTPPQGVFHIKDLHEIKYALSKYFQLLVKNSVREGQNPEYRMEQILRDEFFYAHFKELEQRTLEMHKRMFEAMLEEWLEQQEAERQLALDEQEAQIEAMREMGLDEESIMMTLPELPPEKEPPVYHPPHNLSTLVYQAYTILKKNWREYDSYLVNTRVDLFRLIFQYQDIFEHHPFINYKYPQGINIASYIWREFLLIGRLPALYEQRITDFANHVESLFQSIDRAMDGNDPRYRFTKGFQEPYEHFRDEMQELLLRLKKFINPGRAVVQSFTRETGRGSETILDISMPICNLNYFRKGLIRNYLGAVHIGISLTNINFTIGDVQRTLQLIALIVLIVGMVISFLLATVLVAPVRRMVAAMRQIGEGELDVKVHTSSNDEIGLLAANFNDMAEGLREKERIRSIMDKVVSKEIAEEMLKGEIKLGGETRIITMFFSDIRRFTSISESLSPENLIIMLNEYLSVMNGIIDEEGGVVDKFIGDAIMALFGAPIPLTDDDGNPYDSEAAVRASLFMLKALEEFNKKRRESNEQELTIGIGLNTGPVVAGNMGSEQRMNYTVLGDGVNLASRLEGTTKVYGVPIVISESTYEAIQNKERYYFRELDLIKVVGKTQPVKIYEVMGFKNPKA